ncbi:MAG TPA: glutamine synthetase [Rickettsiales bacterium]|nr:glutamine synthetase [Rickettsiales bacterium]
MFTPVIATEIEFYLHGADEKFTPEQIITLVKEGCDKACIWLASAEQERGRNQYEIALNPSPDYKSVATATEYFKTVLADTFLPHGIKDDFSAKPLPDQPGSGLHIHLHLEDTQGVNIFTRENDVFSAPLLHAMGGLLAGMNPNMMVFAPYPESYLRFTGKSNAPTTVSWGTNNRTTALRLPNKPLNNKHIEHRVAGSDANILQVIEVILAGAFYGIEKRCNPGEPIYGDASLPQYNLPLLARNIEEAAKYREEAANNVKASTDY